MLEQLLPYAPQLGMLIIICSVLYSAHKNKDSEFNIYDYFIDPATKKASITKTGQTIAILTSTWVVGKLTVAGTISVEMLAVYLAALGVSEGWSKFIGAKYGAKDTEQLNESK